MQVANENEEKNYVWGSAFGATAHAAVYDAAHDAFMTLPHHTRTREGEGQPGEQIVLARFFRSFPHVTVVNFGMKGADSEAC
jgi:hypothetical protein